jgi:4-amino-4-deoxy-L-arabinose transferase-like glycosyltransferase
MTTAVRSQAGDLTPEVAERQDNRRLKYPWALVLLLTGTALLYLWGLSTSGWANAFYSAAAQAGAQSWKAFLFGSSDGANSITVDKPPLSLWLTGLSARVLGFSSFAILLPQALCTVASVGLLYATVRRVLGEAAGVAAAVALALTPVTVAIGRVNNPDALLVLLLVLSAYLLVRALESGRTRWLAWCGAVVGLAFMTAGLWVTWRAPRTSRRRALWILFGVWALVHVAVFSSQKGIFHPYYASALAPAVAALSGAGVVLLWRWARESWAAWALLAATVCGTAWLAASLLSRTPDFAGWLRVAIPVAAVLAVAASLALRVRAPRAVLAVAALAGAFALAAGPASYSIANLPRSLNGDNVTAGPASASRGGFGGTMGGGPPAGGVMRGGRDSQVSASLISYLVKHQGSAKYLVAATSSHTTAPIIIQTGKAVVTIGGFSGGDNAPTLAQLKAMIAAGELKYVLVAGAGAGGGPDRGSSAITSWVTSHGKQVSGQPGLYAVSA